MIRRLSVAAIALVVSVPGIAVARSIPAHTGLVVDEAGLLGYALEQQLSQSLLRFQQQHGPQIQLLTIKSLEGAPIEDFSIRVAESWKLGSERKDDGVILIVALEDRAVRIEVGQGVEGDIPDAIAGRIIREDILPRFKSGAYEAGVVSGLQAIAERLGGSLQAIPARRVVTKPSSGGGGGLLLLMILLFFVLPRFFGGGGFGRRHRSTLGGLATGMILGGMGRRRGPFGGGGGFGGGFGGGGGGGFSGGGASGKW